MSQWFMPVFMGMAAGHGFAVFMTMVAVVVPMTVFVLLFIVHVLMLVPVAEHKHQ